ncbi:hypothetical protein WK80_22200 [Burkholderia multivorans]|nr:hypothetical protein WK80_22200 [Burkholderia multivorans]
MNVRLYRSLHCTRSISWIVFRISEARTLCLCRFGQFFPRRIGADSLLILADDPLRGLLNLFAGLLQHVLLNFPRCHGKLVEVCSECAEAFELLHSEPSNVRVPKLYLFLVSCSEKMIDHAVRVVLSMLNATSNGTP